MILIQIKCIIYIFFFQIKNVVYSDVDPDPDSFGSGDPDPEV